MTAPKTNYTRDELVAICERAVVPVDKWCNRDSAQAHEKLGVAWALLKAGCDFTIHPAHPEGKHGCFTDDEMIWLTIEWPGFTAFEYDRSDRTYWQDSTFYLPTLARLESTDGEDWY